MTIILHIPLKGISNIENSGSSHYKVTNFYVGCRPTITFLIFPSLETAMKKIHDTKYRHRRS